MVHNLCISGLTVLFPEASSLAVNSTDAATEISVATKSVCVSIMSPSFSSFSDEGS